MYFDNKIWIGDANGEKICITPKMANRHGLIAGATGTGKTVTYGHPFTGPGAFIRSQAAMEAVKDIRSHNLGGYWLCPADGSG